MANNINNECNSSNLQSNLKDSQFTQQEQLGGDNEIYKQTNQDQLHQQTNDNVFNTNPAFPKSHSLSQSQFQSQSNSSQQQSNTESDDMIQDNNDVYDANDFNENNRDSTSSEKTLEVPNEAIDTADM
ncbi:hypothetical protein KGF54_000210 [Candida jiufengensis]|uniref:uncharacterized protein n=1 Tax=Candida jiufengensis TaxID=497108 RepID=UPI002223FB47|nr:uncharacterized protein KGF54_000210 [Candida jiufengensis]KAI5957282.1 hypothetical protein KGF54_000210 [Candida jiufengensis]